MNDDYAAAEEVVAERLGRDAARTALAALETAGFDVLRLTEPVLVGDYDGAVRWPVPAPDYRGRPGYVERDGYGELAVIGVPIPTPEGAVRPLAAALLGAASVTPISAYEFDPAAHGTGHLSRFLTDEHGDTPALDTDPAATWFTLGDAHYAVSAGQWVVRWSDGRITTERLMPEGAAIFEVEP